MKKLTQEQKTINLQNHFTKQIKTYLFLIVAFMLFGLQYGNAQMDTHFVTTWKTDNYGTTSDTSIKIPAFSGETYNYDVDWDNDGIFDEFNITGDVTHNFGTTGTYTIRIQGTFPRIYFNYEGDYHKIIQINQWGTNQWSSMEKSFYGCNYIDGVVNDIPDLSQVTSTAKMFFESDFNQPINNWNVSNVTDMSWMFANSDFNQSINSWNVSNVNNMSHIFFNCAFYQSITNWDVSNVTDMSSMFKSTGCSDSIANWNVSNVANMSSMFAATSFNQAIDSWNVSNVTDMSYMFENASSFNQPIGNWDVSHVINMNSMFKNASSFNQSIENWNVGNVTNMSRMFKGSWGYAYNQPIGNWDVSNVTNMFEMFHTADHFNQSIGNWNVSNVTNMDSMFLNALAFNQPINNWNVSNVINMEDMFLGANTFNQPLNNWDVSNVTNMNGMFEDADTFDQNIGNWNVSNVISIARMFRYADGLSTQNYDNLLIGWNSLSLHNGLVFQAQSATYCDGATARTAIINNFGWSIVDAGEDPNCGITCPTPSTQMANNQTLTGADLSWTENGTATLWDIEIGQQGFSNTGTPNNENVSNPFTWTDGVESTSYDYYVRSDCSGDNTNVSTWQGPFTFTTLSSNCNVCSSEGDLSYQTSTTLVQIGSINNASGKTTYSDFTSINTNLSRSTSYDLVVRVNTDGDFPVNTIVWIDWNQNCSFDDAGEEYILGTAQNVSDGAVSNSPLSITVPNDSFLGSTTMRISTIYDTTPATSCQTSFDGEVEDYTITVLESVSCPTPTNLAVTNITPSGADLNWIENGTATQWDLEIGIQNFTPTGTPTNENISNPFIWSDGTESTSYDYYVRADCSGNNSDVSTWEGPFSFTTYEFCENPSNGISNNITSDSAELSWTENGTATTWNIEYKIVGSATSQTITTTNNPYQLTNLTDNADYEFYISSFCDPNSSDLIGPFYFSTIAACLTPTNLKAESITTNSASLSWNTSSSETHWDIFITSDGVLTDNATIPTINDATSNPYSWTDATSNTTYKFYVRADCGSDNSYVSDWSIAHEFTTPCEVQTLPYEQNFNTNTDCWTFNNIDNDISEWENSIGCNNNGFTIKAYNNLNDWVFSPGFNLQSGIDYQIDFTYNVGTSLDNTDDLVVYLLDANNPSGNIETTLLTVTENTTDCTNFSNLQVNVSTDNIYYIAFYASSVEDNLFEISIDDFSIMETPSCPEPSFLNVQNVSDNSATLNWTNNSSATSFNVKYIKSEDPIDDANFTNIVVSGTTTNISGLEANTDYDFYVQAICAADDLSSWTNSFTFKTLCGSYIAYFSEYFDNSNQLPDCWSQIGSGTGFVQITTNNNPYSTDNHVEIAPGSQAGEYQIITTPQFSDLTSQNNQIRFFAKSYSSGGVLEIGTMTNPLDETTFTNLTTLSLDTNYQEFSYAFDENYTASDNYIAFKVIDDNPKVYIDNFVYEETPPCPVSSTWNGTAWSDGVPDETINAILTSDYEDNSFTCCSLIVENCELYIDDGSYIEVIHNVVVNGEDGHINIENGGSFVQRDDDATVTGYADYSYQMEINTTSMQDFYRFSYVSSPSANCSIETAFEDWAQMNYIWHFNGSTQHWNHIPDNQTIMNVGEGYAIRGDSEGTYPEIKSSYYVGPFNNGVITKQLSYNVGQQETDASDDDSNFFGNPYPSAIDGQALLTNNTNANAFYFWTHASAMTENGFTVDDYAIWNSSGGTSGSGTAPRYIASGQGFFVEALDNGNFTFNNSIRVTDNNGDIRNNKTLVNDKLWLSLSNSSESLNNEILIAFNNNGSNGFDPQYDANKLMPSAAIAFYSMDNQTTNSYGIQTRAIITDTDVIPLGVIVNEPNATDLKISISNIELFNNTSIYLRDNELNIIHDLRISDYSFYVSQTGVYNERFELFLQRNALGVNYNLYNKDQLIISNIDESRIKVKMLNGSEILELEAYDLLGKLILKSKPNRSKFILNTPNLKQGTVLFFKVKLKNGKIVMNRFIKL